MLGEIKENVLLKGINLSFSEYLESYIAEIGYSQKCGARSLRRTITEEIGNRLTECFISGEIGEGSRVLFDYKDGKIILEKEKARL